MVATYVVTGVGVLISLITAVAIVSVGYGSLKNQVNDLRNRQATWATKEDLAPIKEALAEIKGMFRLELKNKP